MRPPKISRDELLQRCASTFKRYGYNGTTMDMLSSACGLTKASFYHHYPNKESLLRDVLETTHEKLKESLFAVAYDDSKAPAERLSTLGRKAQKLFQDDTIGCLMGVVAVDASYSNADLMQPIRAFMDDWALAFTHIFSPAYGREAARTLGRQLVADYEGAILLARIYQDPGMIEAVTARTLEALEARG
ncbi:TetR/AcrR family transcriptional regulator [Pseudomonas sp. LABIM340]|uniref:TetR/AcrR family transcriptional regulator n=1 Tax=Pseudomonas sp. LABIM340 TaxID=3156585 RepID=UPI0032AF4D66